MQDIGTIHTTQKMSLKLFLLVKMCSNKNTIHVSKLYKIKKNSNHANNRYKVDTTKNEEKAITTHKITHTSDERERGSFCLRYATGWPIEIDNNRIDKC